MQNEKARMKRSTPEKLGHFARLVWRDDIWLVVSFKGSTASDATEAF
jgi:hypothetical protein